MADDGILLFNSPLTLSALSALAPVVEQATSRRMTTAFIESASAGTAVLLSPAMGDGPDVASSPIAISADMSSGASSPILADVLVKPIRAPSRDTDPLAITMRQWVEQGRGSLQITASDGKAFDVRFNAEQSVRMIGGTMRTNYRIEVFDADRGVAIGFVDFVIDEQMRRGQQVRVAYMWTAHSTPKSFGLDWRISEAIFVDEAYRYGYHGIGEMLMSLALRIAAIKRASEFLSLQVESPGFFGVIGFEVLPHAFDMLYSFADHAASGFPRTQITRAESSSPIQETPAQVNARKILAAGSFKLPNGLQEKIIASAAEIPSDLLDDLAMGDIGPEVMYALSRSRVALSKEEERLLWSVFHRRYGELSDRKEVSPMVSAVIDEAMRQSNDEVSILEVGCGPRGEALRGISEAYRNKYPGRLKAWGVDLSVEENGIENVSLVSGDMRALSFPSETFDVVFESHTLGYFRHADSFEQVIHEIMRVLKPGGKFVFGEKALEDDFLNTAMLIFEKRVDIARIRFEGEDVVLEKKIAADYDVSASASSPVYLSGLGDIAAKIHAEIGSRGFAIEDAWAVIKAVQESTITKDIALSNLSADDILAIPGIMKHLRQITNPSKEGSASSAVLPATLASVMNFDQSLSPAELMRRCGLEGLEKRLLLLDGKFLAVDFEEDSQRGFVAATIRRFTEKTLIGMLPLGGKDIGPLAHGESLDDFVFMGVPQIYAEEGAHDESGKRAREYAAALLSASLDGVIGSKGVILEVADQVADIDAIIALFKKRGFVLQGGQPYVYRTFNNQQDRFEIRRDTLLRLERLRFEEGERAYVKFEHASSPAREPESDAKGGIDFRALPITVSPVAGRLLSVSGRLSATMSINLEKEWQEIQNTVNAGIIPSSERIKEYLQNCCGQSDFDQEIDKVLHCLADILRLEEDRVSVTDPRVRQMVVLLESSSSSEVLQIALSEISAVSSESMPRN
ncbi:MAG: class I SAM-dependent methyltransferase [Candidatus Omnitrophica bacterium]|nr:class I SAM-dependent methyltransferase [Candidatus Omnitrophota bacterium]